MLLLESNTHRSDNYDRSYEHAGPELLIDATAQLVNRGRRRETKCRSWTKMGFNDRGSFCEKTTEIQLKGQTLSLRDFPITNLTNIRYSSYEC